MLLDVPLGSHEVRKGRDALLVHRDVVVVGTREAVLGPGRRGSGRVPPAAVQKHRASAVLDEQPAVGEVRFLVVRPHLLLCHALVDGSTSHAIAQRIPLRVRERDRLVRGGLNSRQGGVFADFLHRLRPLHDLHVQVGRVVAEQCLPVPVFLVVAVYALVQDRLEGNDFVAGQVAVVGHLKLLSPVRAIRPWQWCSRR